MRDTSKCDFSTNLCVLYSTLSSTRLYDSPASAAERSGTTGTKVPRPELQIFLDCTTYNPTCLEYDLH